MNERLLEFVKQAGISTTDHGRGSFIDDHVSLGDLERFAQLIVQECCDWIDGSPASDAGQLLLSKSFIIANLKGHFSVDK